MGTSMTLKEGLEAVWNRPGVMFPNHRCRFHSGPRGYEILKDILYVSAGVPVGRVRSKKGYSFLPKNYYLYWLHQRKVSLEHFSATTLPPTKK